MQKHFTTHEGSIPMDQEAQRKQLDDQRMQVDFDTYDLTVDDLLRRIERGKLDVAPSYQRKFRWDSERQSSLIESIFLGIPVPPLFMATDSAENQATKWEVVDGLQRVTTLVNFAGSAQAKADIHLENFPPLKLAKLKKLSQFNNSHFDDLPVDIRSTFEDRPLKVIVLNDKSDIRVRFDLFERLNTGGIRLSDQEVRECVFRGPFINLLNELAENPDFRSFLLLSQNQGVDGTISEYVLRFFAYLERYTLFEHSVKGFLDDFCKNAWSEDRIDSWRSEFFRVFRFLHQSFPEGLRGSRRSTPVNLYEGVAVGAALALRSNPTIKPPSRTDWTGDPKLKSFVNGATNTKPKVVGRIEFCRDKFLGD